MGEDASEERSLFEPRDEGARAYVASDLGVLTVDVGPDRIGEFSLSERCQARAIGVDESLVAVATGDSLLIGADEGFAPTGFGPAVAVGIADGAVFGAGPDGRVARCVPDGSHPETTDWAKLGTVSEPRRFDGQLLAASDGVYRVTEALETVRAVGARDVTSDGPQVATDDGLFRSVSGEWQCEHEGVATAVAGRHAVDNQGLLKRTGDGWTRVTSPATLDPVDLVAGDCLYAVTEDGAFLMSVPSERATDGQGGWRSRMLGVRGVTGLAVCE